MSSWPKRFPCGRIVTLAEWLTLPLVGTMFEDEPEHALQSRNCVPPCKSTHSVLVSDLGGALRRAS